MCNVSHLGVNIRDVCFKNDIDQHNFHTVSIGEMNNKIIRKWSESVNDEDKQVGMQVLELCIDSLTELVFHTVESLILLIFNVSYSIYLYYSTELF